MPPEEDMNVVVITGDGAAYGMGVSSTSGAIDRGLDFLYLCYDNEGYGNTGQQTSGATPHAARTATAVGSAGYPGFKKNLFDLWVANRPTYVATVIAAEPLDLARKIEKAASLSGPRLILSLAPCPTGWDYDPQDTTEIGRLAVRTGVWPLKEYANGEVVHTKVRRPRLPVEEYLVLQGRFRHLFEPVRKQDLIDEIQARVDVYWERVEAAARGTKT
jgi:pyruvate ferredoxin oxidoreductase beta subunit